jgi:excisionase family DNA binding protein
MKLATDAQGDLRKYYSPQHVADALSLHRRTVLQMIRRGEIQAVNPVANRIRISSEEVERLLKERS